MIKVTPSALPEVLLIEPRLFHDERGFFFESWNAQVFAQACAMPLNFVQDNHSHSLQHVLRGLHYQVVKPQGKLVRVVSGRIFDVAVDLRRSSARFGQWCGVELSADNAQQLWIPPGFAHGFLVLSTHADVMYKTTEYWMPEHDRCLAWNDPQLNIAWPLSATPRLSSKDAQAPLLAQAETFA